MSKENPLQNLWPEMDSQKHAKNAAKQAVGAALFSAVITAALAIASVYGYSVPGFVDVYSLIDVAFLVVLAYGIWKMSRAAAGIALIYFVFSSIVVLTEGGTGSIVVRMFFLLAYINGIRGTFAYHKMNKTTGLQLLDVIYFALALAITALVAFGYATEFSEKSQFDSTVTREIRSDDGSASVQANGIWKEIDTHEDAIIQLQHREEIYTMLLSEPKEDVSLRFNEYIDRILEFFIEDVPNAELISGPHEKVLHETPAIQYEYTGSWQGVNLVFIYTFVETPNRYNQIVTWGASSKIREYRKDIDALLSGFRL